MCMDRIHWLGHDAFRIEGDGRVVYIDPWGITGGQPRADLLLITHEHHDHFSPPDVSKVSGPETVIFTTASVAEKLHGDVRVLRPGEEGEAHGVRIEAVPAYNLDKPFHPQEREWLGFVVRFKTFSVYHAGDTDRIPEMKGIHADVALLPVSGTYVMTAEEAAEAAAELGPKVAVPMHFDSIVGDRSDAERFQALYEGKSVILEKE